MSQVFPYLIRFYLNLFSLPQGLVLRVYFIVIFFCFLRLLQIQPCTSKFLNGGVSGVRWTFKENSYSWTTKHGEQITRCHRMNSANKRKIQADPFGQLCGVITERKSKQTILNTSLLRKKKNTRFLINMLLPMGSSRC